MRRRADAAAPRMADLVGRARDGDREAYGELVELMWPPLVALARTILAGDDEAEDIVQDALVGAWTRLASLRRPERFPAWIRRIVSRRCFVHLRRRRAPAVPMAAPPAEPRPEDIDIRRLLNRLAPRQRAVIYLTVVEGRSAREAAAVLGILPATARVHRHRALARLRRELEEDAMSESWERLARQLRRWAERPSSLAPAAARTRVLARLPSRRRRPAWRLAAAAGALATIALALALVLGRRPEPLPGPPPAAASAERVIVHQLSSGTTLYIVVRTGAEG